MSVSVSVSLSVLILSREYGRWLLRDSHSGVCLTANEAMSPSYAYLSNDRKSQLFLSYRQVIQ